MRVVSLLYHDIHSRHIPDVNCRQGYIRTRYNMEAEDFASHLAAIRETGRLPTRIGEIRHGSFSLLLTFDDGNSSAYSCAADLLENYNWYGHFFIPTDYIGRPGFLDKAQIRELSHRGHVIGSHSCSHPHRMTHCSWSELSTEWTRSVGTLSDILAEQITTASVPGGHYSKKVAQAACVAGIRSLFTSEPVTKCHHVDDCLVLGRYTILRGMAPTAAADLARCRAGAILKQYMSWNSKKLVRCLGGQSYVKLRSRVLAHEYRRERIANS